MHLRHSYSYKEIEQAFRKENPNASDKEVQDKAKEIYKEIVSLDGKERGSNRKYRKHIDFSGSDYELDLYLTKREVCTDINGNKIKLTFPKGDDSLLRRMEKKHGKRVENDPL